MTGKLTQTALMERGWTKGMIKKFLPEPTLARNPRSSKCPIKLWDISAVEAAEQMPEYSADAEKAERRRASSAKAVETKKEKLKHDLSAAVASIRVPVLDDDELRELALEHYKNLRSMRSDYYNEYEDNPECASEATLQRWIVNYIRHCLIEYDDVLWLNKGRAGMSSQYCEFKDAILAKIAEAYPKYAEECRRQSFAIDVANLTGG